MHRDTLTSTFTSLTLSSIPISYWKCLLSEHNCFPVEICSTVILSHTNSLENWLNERCNYGFLHKNWNADAALKFSSQYSFNSSHHEIYFLMLTVPQANSYQNEVKPQPLHYHMPCAIYCYDFILDFVDQQ